jgi:HEAT repeat protein
MDPDPSVVRSVMLALGARSDAESRAVLTSVAGDVRRECGIRGRAALILRSAGPDDCFAGLLASAAAGAPGAGEALAGVGRAGDRPLELDLLRALGRAIVPPVGPALAEAVARAEDTVRLAGAAALLDYDGRAARAVLEPALRSNDPDEALEAVELLAAHQSARADDVLRAVAGSSTVAGRVAEMILFARGEGRVSTAFEALGDPDREVRAAACRGLAARLRVDPDRAGGERARAALRERLRAADPVVQAAAIASMDATLDADRAALDALLDHEDPATRVRAAARLTGVDQLLEAGVPPR